MGSSMLIGFNNDVEYKGRMFHIQTEDHGIKDGHITSILFFSGQILDSKKVGYLEEVKGLSTHEEKTKVIKKRMVELHREFYKCLFEGRYDENVTRLASGKSSVQMDAIPEESAPPPTLPPADALPKKPPPPPPEAKGSAKKPVDSRHSFRGLIWPKTDLSLDKLVAEFLSKAA